MPVIEKPASTFLKVVQKDPKIKKFFELLESGVYSTVDFEAVYKELKGLHSVRKLRSAKATKLFTSSRVEIADLLLENSAHRSRVVEIKLEYFKYLKMLTEHIKTITNYVNLKYQSELNKEFRTIKAKSDAIVYLLDEFAKLQHAIENIIKICDEIIKDIDQAYWTMKTLVDVIITTLKRSDT